MERARQVGARHRGGCYQHANASYGTVRDARKLLWCAVQKAWVHEPEPIAAHLQHKRKLMRAKCQRTGTVYSCFTTGVFACQVQAGAM